LTQIPVLVRQLRLPGQRSDKDLLRPNLGTTEESVTDWQQYQHTKIS